MTKNYEHFDLMREHCTKHIIPTGHEVLFISPVMPERTRGGVFIPHDIPFDQWLGTILAWGPTAFKNEEIFPNGREYEIGDHIIMGNVVVKRFPIKIPLLDRKYPIQASIGLIDDCYLKAKCSFEYLQFSVS